MKKNYMFTPGPTMVPPEVLMAEAMPLIHHRTNQFSRIMVEVNQGLQKLFGTEQDVYLVMGSGTAAMEAAVANVCSPGDTAVCAVGGKFGERWADLCEAYGCEVVALEVEWGKSAGIEDVSAALDANAGARALFLTHSETSTGALTDVEALARLTRKTETLLVVDGISGMGASPCPMDKWHVDVLISGAQKSFMTPPGLSYIAFSQPAWKHIERAALPRFYFDAVSAREALKRKTSAWTPAISLIRQQKAALDLIRKIGLENLIAHHRIMGEAVRTGIQALDLELLSRRPGDVLTAVKVPAGIDGGRLVELMHTKYRVYIAGAQAPHKGEFFRIGHLGYTGGFDIITALSALEMTLDDLGFPVKKGASTGAAESILKEHWS
ncbi:MAG: pyridoxal-phosphate-dependent aminotransferase family protein [Candidatus Aminicenantaceae bacterium]